MQSRTSGTLCPPSKHVSPEASKNRIDVDNKNTTKKGGRVKNSWMEEDQRSAKQARLNSIPPRRFMTTSTSSNAASSVSGSS